MSEKKRFLLRVDGELYEALERWAGDELRSVNAQIEFLLTQAVRRAGRAPARTAGGGAIPPPGHGAEPGRPSSEPQNTTI
jgi:hypothetical protein